MIDTLNLDQLRVFAAIADHGSFSAAARHLRRAQSAVSNAVVKLECALGVPLFDRGAWKPQLTVAGLALLAEARAVLARADQLKARAVALSKGLEAELAIVVDVMFPAAQLVDLVARFQLAFPAVPLRLCTEVLGGVPERVLTGEYDLGIQGSLPDIPDGLLSHLLPAIAVTPVAAPGHALATVAQLSGDTLRRHRQIVLTDRSGRTAGRTFFVFAEQRILTTDLGSKHAMLRAGLAWGFMPHSVVEEDLAAGRLIELDLAERAPGSRSMPLFLIFRRDDPPGPAGRWLVDALLAQGRSGPDAVIPVASGARLP